MNRKGSAWVSVVSFIAAGVFLIVLWNILWNFGHPPQIETVTVYSNGFAHDSTYVVKETSSDWDNIKKLLGMWPVLLLFCAPLILTLVVVLPYFIIKATLTAGSNTAKFIQNKVTETRAGPVDELDEKRDMINKLSKCENSSSK